MSQIATTFLLKKYHCIKTEAASVLHKVPHIKYFLSLYKIFTEEGSKFSYTCNETELKQNGKAKVQFHGE